MAPKKTIKKSEEPINEVNEIDNIKTETESKPKKTKREKVIVEKDLEIGEPVMTFWLNQAV